MTEQEWMTCTDPKKMLDFVGTRASKRRLRLFAVAGARDLLEHNPDSECRGDYGDSQAFAASIQRAEAYADGQGPLQYGHADRGIWVEIWDDKEAAYAVLGKNADSGMWLRDPAEVVPTAIQDFQVNPTQWLRCLFGNPFRPATLDPAWLSWHNRLPVSMARQMYDSRDFADMPVLADALEEAGCRDADILGHCRFGGDHVRGCWVVDLLLGKE